MRLGAGFDPEAYLQDSDYRYILDANFDSLTPCWGLIPENTLFNQSMNIDIQVKLAIAKAVSAGKRIYGHYLIGRGRPPAWVYQMAQKFPNGDSSLLEYLITKNIAGYQGLITDWVVANECFSQVGLIPSYWTKLSGKERLIDRVFRAAHKADPSAVLWISEYGIQNAKLWDRLYLEVRAMLDRGVPIHGVSTHLHTDLYYRRNGLEISGIPAHLFPYHSIKGERLRTEVRRFKALGVAFHLSELTVWPKLDTPERIQAQGRVYKRYVKIAIEEGCDLISFWTVLDDYRRPDLSWHWQGKRDYPGLWIRNGGSITPKPYTEHLLRMIP